MKTITNSKGQKVEITDKMYNQLFNFKIGEWVMINSVQSLCTTHTDGKNYPGFTNGLYINKDFPCKIIDITPLTHQLDAHIVFQHGKSFIFSSSEDFSKAISKDITRYQDTFQIGDLIVMVNNGFLIGSEASYEKPYRITSFDCKTKEQETPYYKWFIHLNNKIYGGANEPMCNYIRHITADEMREYETVDIGNDFTVKISPEGEKVNISAEDETVIETWEFHFDEIYEIYHKMKNLQPESFGKMQK